MVGRNDGRGGYERATFLARRPEGESTLGGVPPVDGVPRGRFDRRRLLKWVIRAGYLAFGVAFLVPATALRSLSLGQRTVAAGDPLVYAPTTSGAPVGEPLRADDLTVGTGVQVFPEGKQDDQHNLIEVVRVAEGNDGLVAYSAICTHLGCAVYARLSEDRLIVCPCHASKFDPNNHAAVVGGPATHPLPSLPVQVAADGSVAAAGVFSGPVGIAE